MSPSPGLGPASRFARSVASLTRRPPGRRRISPVTSAFAILIGLGIVALLAFVQVSSTPQFCGTCHIMKPYYKAWQSSSHSKIACVECHISPGITAEVRKKYEALSMVVKYFTATYGTRPWGEVDDAACLRCHERRLIEGRVQFHGVNFDHTPHLTESRRGLRLRCTSCHSQVVQGTHLTVTTSTCALCHFKNQPANQKLGACRRCHEVPETVALTARGAFDHGQVSRLGMECTSCHGNIVRGDGAVAKERCLGCHNQADRLARFGETLFLHDMHVSQHKVDCQACHSLIEHGSMPPNPPTAAINPCQTCHGMGHSPQEDLYAGKGGRGVPRMPSPMFLTGVTCQGCHNPSFSFQTASVEPSGPHTAAAGAVSCMSCHGPSYEAIFAAWKKGSEERTEALRRAMENSAGAMGLEPPQEWEDARHNFALVSKGKGIHNINFAYVLLDKAFDQMNAARRAKGLAGLTRPWTSMSAASPCLTCHLGIEHQRGEFNGRPFAHGPHLAQAKLDCEQCHRKHAERPKVEVVRFGPDGCASCHHKNAQAPSLATCARCHGDPRRTTFPTFLGEFSHAKHAEVGLECAGCHSMASGDPRPPKTKCAECHE